jgi:predicted transcriptional regulator
MNFQEQVKPLLKSLRKGDLNEIADRSGLSRQTVRDALKLDTLVGATENQIKVWEVAGTMTKERQEEAKKKEEKLVSLAKTLKQ